MESPFSEKVSIHKKFRNWWKWVVMPKESYSISVFWTNVNLMERLFYIGHDSVLSPTELSKIQVRLFNIWELFSKFLYDSYFSRLIHISYSVMWYIVSDIHQSFRFLLCKFLGMSFIDLLIVCLYFAAKDGSRLNFPSNEYRRLQAKFQLLISEGWLFFHTIVIVLKWHSPFWSLNCS